MGEGCLTSSERVKIVGRGLLEPGNCPPSDPFNRATSLQVSDEAPVGLKNCLRKLSSVKSIKLTYFVFVQKCWQTFYEHLQK